MVGSYLTLDYGGNCYTTSGSASWTNCTSSTSTATSTGWASVVPSIKFLPSNMMVNCSYDFVEPVPSKLAAGAGEIELPDGAKLIIDDQGNYRIEDKDAKVTYKANRIREFSPHLNASDMVAKFVEYVGGLGVRQAEVLGLPLELFINWLIIEAAERDQDPVPVDVVPVQRHPDFQMIRKPKCRACGRFIPLRHQRHRFPFCGPDHGARWMEKRTNPVRRIAHVTPLLSCR